MSALENFRFREDLPFILNKMGLTGLGVEVGVLRGEFSKHLLTYWEGKKLYSIDAWRHFEEGYNDVNNGDHNFMLDCMAKTFMSVYREGPRSVLIRDLSVEASALFADRSLDFVYLDANHSREAVKADLKAWAPKVKSGGLLCGHDYLNASPEASNISTEFGVKAAVDLWASLNSKEIYSTKETYPSWIIQL